MCDAKGTIDKESDAKGTIDKESDAKGTIDKEVHRFGKFMESCRGGWMPPYAQELLMDKGEETVARTHSVLRTTALTASTLRSSPSRRACGRTML